MAVRPEDIEELLNVHNRVEIEEFTHCERTMKTTMEWLKSVLFVLAMLAIYRIGAFISAPGVNIEALRFFFFRNEVAFLGFLDPLSGGDFGLMTIFALGIMPYVTASIILQLLTVVWPYLEKLSKEGKLGRRKTTAYTRYLTIVLSLVQSGGMAFSLQREPQFVFTPGIGFTVTTMLFLTTGAVFMMWLYERITERGIGYGMSLMVLAGIIAGLPSATSPIYKMMYTHEWSALTAIIHLAVMFALVAWIDHVRGKEQRRTTERE